MGASMTSSISSAGSSSLSMGSWAEPTIFNASWSSGFIFKTLRRACLARWFRPFDLYRPDSFL